MLALMQLIASNEVGNLNVKHLKRYWHKHSLIYNGEIKETDLPNEWNIDTTLLGILNLGLEILPAIKYFKIHNFLTKK